MEYTVQKLAKLAGVSTRTLRYYDELNLLVPARISASGYRIYGAAEVNRLQQILFYRELGVELGQIKALLDLPTFDAAEALRTHRTKLLTQRERLEKLIANVDKSIEAAEGRTKMKDAEKFEGFKKNMIEENERKYGDEIREKYGKEAVEKSNQKLMGLSQEQYDESVRISAQMMETLAAAFATGDPAGELAQKAADLHRQWLGFYWDAYSKEAHAGLARMYVEDERFTAHYDEKQPGTARFLRDAILIYIGENE